MTMLTITKGEWKWKFQFRMWHLLIITALIVILGIVFKNSWAIGLGIIATLFIDPTGRYEPYEPCD